MKIEFDLPQFEKEVSINIVIRKDGEVVETVTKSPSSPTINNTADMEDFVAGLQKAVDGKGARTAKKQQEGPSTPAAQKPKSSGNFMDPGLFN